MIEKHLLVILGATGDLAHRKILPALMHIDMGDSRVLGVAMPSDLNDESFRASVQADDAFRQKLFYQTIGRAEKQDYQALAARIATLERDHNLTGNRIFYLALPPQAFEPTIVGLGEAGLNKSPGWTRIVIEKPFGRDLASAQELNGVLHQHFDESQVYRIDHYLGKETVQNLLVFRFANPIFETLWNRDRIEKVEITVAESLGIENRAGYYEGAGALRDMIQNHVTQLVTSTALELPSAIDSASIRYEKTKVLRAIPPINPADVAFGQYSGYRQEPGVAPDSNTETFVALKLEIANLRWYGVPFYLHTGKRMPRQVSQIAVTFRQPPATIFNPYDTRGMNANVLIITIQPDEGFDLHFEVKHPGREIGLDRQSLHFRYSEAFAPLAEAYQTLLMDVMAGDQTLFVSDEWAEASWRLYTPLLEHRPQVLPYEQGTWGPSGLERLSWPPASVRAS